MDKFSSEQVVPDMIDAVPSEQLKVSFGGVDVAPGQTLTPTQTKNQPSLSWTADAGSFYSVLMMGLDAPSRQDRSAAEIIFWHVINIPGNDISKGQAISEYLGAAPSKGSGLHRFALVVYKQASQVTDAKITQIFVSKTERKGRQGRKTRQFAEQMGWGQPVAGNFFQAEWDEAVPAIYKQIGYDGE